jgi:hypothetical protein
MIRFVDNPTCATTRSERSKVKAAQGKTKRGRFKTGRYGAAKSELDRHTVAVDLVLTETALREW